MWNIRESAQGGTVWRFNAGFARVENILVVETTLYDTLGGVIQSYTRSGAQKQRGERRWEGFMRNTESVVTHRDLTKIEKTVLCSFIVSPTTLRRMISTQKRDCMYDVKHTGECPRPPQSRGKRSCCSSCSVVVCGCDCSHSGNPQKAGWVQGLLTIPRPRLRLNEGIIPSDASPACICLWLAFLGPP